MTEVSAIRLHRVYEEPSADDGARVLVDRVWPRGLSKDAAALTAWLKDVAPSAGLRRWYSHDPQRYRDFRDRYRAELADPAHAEAVARLRELAGQGPVTLLTATKDVGLSNATVLREWLLDGGRG